MTSDNPGDYYEEPPTAICDEQVEQVELIADADLYVYFGGRDNVILDEWVSGERVSAAVERYTNGVAAMDECVDAGSFDPVETSYPGIDEARRYEQLTVVDDDANQQRPEDNDQYHTWLYARNGGVIMLLSFGLGRREDYSDDLIERMIGTALGKLASIGRVEVDTSSNNVGQTVPTDGVDVTLPPLDSTPPEWNTDLTQPPVTSSEQVPASVAESTSEGVVATEVTESTPVSDDVVEAALLTLEAFPGGWATDGEASVGGFWEDQEPFRYCPNGVEMMVPVTRGYVSFIPEWNGEYNISLSDDGVFETVSVFASPEDVTSWFDGAESCVGQEFEFEDPYLHVTLELLAVPHLGDESRGFRTIVPQGELPAHDTYSVFVRLGEVLVIVSYINYGPDPSQPNQSFLDDLVETAVTRAEAALG